MLCENHAKLCKYADFKKRNSTIINIKKIRENSEICHAWFLALAQLSKMPGQMTEMKNNTLVSERAHRKYFACRSRFQFLWSKINREYFLLLAVRIAVSYSVADIRSVACCLRYDSSKHPITHLAASIPFHVILLLYVHIFTYSSHKHTHTHPFAAVCRVACVCERVLFLSSIHAQTNDSRIQLNVTVRSFCVSFTRFVRSFGPFVRLLFIVSFIQCLCSLTHTSTLTRAMCTICTMYNVLWPVYLYRQTHNRARTHTHTSIVTGVFEQFDETTNTNHDSCSLWTERSRIEIYIDILNMYICIHSAYQ